MSILNNECLVLNTGFIPVDICTVKDSIGLIYTDKAYPILEEDEYVRSPSIKLKIPSIISLRDYHDFPKKRVHYSRLNVIYRDDMICQFCHKRFSVRDLTVDHIVPKSRWKEVYPEKPFKGFTTWENTVCACKSCNTKKGNKLLRELGWKLEVDPKEPEYMPYFVISLKKATLRGWLPYCKVNVKLVEMLY